MYDIVLTVRDSHARAAFYIHPDLHFGRLRAGAGDSLGVLLQSASACVVPSVVHLDYNKEIGSECESELEGIREGIGR